MSELTMANDELTLQLERADCLCRSLCVQHHHQMMITVWPSAANTACDTAESTTERQIMATP